MRRATVQYTQKSLIPFTCDGSYAGCYVLHSLISIYLFLHLQYESKWNPYYGQVAVFIKNCDICVWKYRTLH
jgi:hypothetical protein